MNIVNLTPHEIVIMNEKEEVIKRVPKSGLIARLETKRVFFKLVDGIPLFQTEYGDPVLLNEIIDTISTFPELGKNTIYIVSSMFRSGLSRLDLWSPGELVRDENGNVIGCIGLSQ